MVRARQSRLLAQVLEEILTRYSFLSFYDEGIRCRFPAGSFDASSVPLRQNLSVTAKAPSIAIFSLSLRVAGTNYGVVGALGWRMNPKRGLLNQKSRP
jgi:hypothetical protein